MNRNWVAAVAITVFTFSPIVGSTARADSGVYKQTLPAVAWVQTQQGSKSYEGTAFVVDTKNRLLMTNYHVAGKADRIVIHFPQRKSGKLITDRSWYARSGNGIIARVVVADSKRDLAVIQAEELPEGVKAIQLADDSSEVGDMVYSVGHPGHEDELWVGNRGKVRSVQRFAITMKPTNQQFNGVAQETGLPISQGASGSPVVNSDGRLVGVVFCGNGDADAGKASTVEYNVDVSEVRKVLTQAMRKLKSDSNDDETQPSPVKPRNSGVPEGGSSRTHPSIEK